MNDISKAASDDYGHDDLNANEIDELNGSL